MSGQPAAHSPKRLVSFSYRRRRADRPVRPAVRPYPAPAPAGRGAFHHNLLLPALVLATLPALILTALASALILVQAGASLRGVQLLAGHRSIQIPRRRHRRPTQTRIADLTSEGGGAQHVGVRSLPSLQTELNHERQGWKP
jgi:hypothetical protein